MAAAILRSMSSSAARRLLFLSRSSFSTIPITAKGFLQHSPRLSPSSSIFRPISDCGIPFALSFKRSFSADVKQFPAFADPDIEAAFKDLMAMSWDEIPDSVLGSTKKALSKNTDDKAGQEALANVFRAAEASVEFGAVLVSLRMALDDLCGLTGENVDRLPDYLEDALKAAYKRYVTYLDAFGPDEAFLKKKVENELGTKMIHLKMRCSGIGSEWGKVTLLGTSGISGSYVEQRA
ncbi:succinate dehydrogenase subunit 5, mitochondrial [Dioscorea cayenensis subsp. rotundata]|uniref:Succinate dehydrogenase subunit 5, mitochondrial n=1 Tax=Dioscorea cayennensis subsp. rotundata TaxID=55577 RepID=A0AB40BDB9_DIOCR|nr:succinate dehydrogenase subunit 5, mitochondrial [Dioscorea cayenensis subsp. rotundata]